MMTTKFQIILIFLISISFFSCKEEERTEYPGNIIISSTFLNLKGSPENDVNAKMYAYSSTDIEEDLGSLNGEDWTYELWIKVDPDCLIGDRFAPNADLANGACISQRAYIFELYLVDDEDADYAITYGRLNGINYHEATMTSHDSSVNLSFDEWVHVAISRSSVDGIAKFYINGVLIDSSDNPAWIQPINEKWIGFNYMYRSGFKNFYKGAMDNIRVSKIDRYPTEFTPNRSLKYDEIINEEGKIEIIGVDEYTLLQLDLEKHLEPHDDNFKRLEIKGSYGTYIKIHNDFFDWETDIIEEYPVTGY